MFELIFSGLFIWLGIYLGKTLEEYVKRSIRIINARQAYIDKHAEYEEWRINRLPELIMQSRRGDLAATAERIARSNHMRASDSRFSDHQRNEYVF